MALAALLGVPEVKDWPAVRRVLTDLSERLKSDPACLPPADLPLVSALVAPQQPALLEALRCLRNAAAVCPAHRRQLSADTDLLHRTAQLLQLPADLPAEARCCAQLLGNLSSCGPEAQLAVWEAAGRLIPTLLASDDTKLVAYTCMLLYNLVRDNREIADGLTGLPEFGPLLSRLFGQISADVDFALFTVQELCRDHLGPVYRHLPAEHRASLLDLLVCSVEDSSVALSDGSLQVLCERCKTCSEPLLRFVDSRTDPADSPGDLADSPVDPADSPVSPADSSLDPADSPADPAELSRLLELLSALSVREEYRSQLQQDTPLLVTVVSLLLAVHRLSQLPGNQFSAVTKLAELTEPRPDVQTQATFGFRCQLLRLLGNLVYRRPEAQRTVREMSALPAVLESCNLDARNPLLQQWAVLAIRNLCEECPENKQAISQLDVQGLAPAAAEELRTLGVTVVEEAGRLRVRPTPDQRGC